MALELQELRDKHEELRAAKQEAVRELLTLQEQHRAEVRILNNSLQEEVMSRENLERRLCELRTEVSIETQLFNQEYKESKVKTFFSSKDCKLKMHLNGANENAWRLKN